MTHGVIDFDYVKYTCAAVGEKRTILVTHRASGNTKEFKNRTEFYGRNKQGGWLAERNATRTSPFQLDEFDIEDLQHAEPVENTLHTVKLTIENCLRNAGVKTYHGYLGKGDSFRVEKSTILEYKGNRKDMIRPIHLDAVSDYLEQRWKAKVVTGLEADDWCVIDCAYNDNILIGVDKDYYGCPVNYYNCNTKEVVNCNQFGELYLNEKGDVKGYGKIFFYFQVASGDTIDHYKANSASTVKWAEKSAFGALSSCKNEGDAIIALASVYRDILYKEPRIITGWRGDQIEVDWLYALTENWNMARMFESASDEFYSQDDIMRMIQGEIDVRK